MIKKILTLLLLFPAYVFAYIDEPYHNTAFIGPANIFYGLSYFSYYSTNHFWNRRGKKLPTYNDFNRKSYRLDTEYTLSCSQSIFLKAGYTMTEEKLNGHSRGFEDPELSWQVLLFKNSSSAFSAKLTGIIPIGPTKSCIRYGKMGGELKFLYSKIFQSLKKPCWIDLGLGYRLYNGFPSDQMNANVSLGYTLVPHVWILSSTQLYYGLFNGKTKFNQNNICFNPNFRLLTTQIQAIAQIYTHLSLNLGGFIHLWGENVGCGGGVYCGTWFIF